VEAATVPYANGALKRESEAKKLRRRQRRQSVDVAANVDYRTQRTYLRNMCVQSVSIPVQWWNADVPRAVARPSFRPTRPSSRSPSFAATDCRGPLGRLQDTFGQPRRTPRVNTRRPKPGQLDGRRVGRTLVNSEANQTSTWRSNRLACKRHALGRMETSRPPGTGSSSCRSERPRSSSGTAHRRLVHAMHASRHPNRPAEYRADRIVCSFVLAACLR
jgi:hypothetical protein